MGQGWGEEGKEEVKKATFPTLLTMIVVQVGMFSSGYVSDLVEQDYSCNTEYNSPIAVLSGTAAAITWLSFNITFVHLG